MIENFKQIGYLHALFVMASHRRKMNSILSASCLLPSIFFFLCSCRVDCYARDTLKQGEWLTDNGTTLVSGQFELGFFTPIRSSSHNRYVGIWYKWNKQTVVWVANRDSPVLNGSFGFAEDGNLKVWDTTGKVYRNTTVVEISPFRIPTVKLMDSGNLVLSYDDDDQLAKNPWESFQYPTDTFLRGMMMDENLNLTSWTNDSDPTSGEFTFKKNKEDEGNYVIFSKNTGLDYWRSWMSDDFMSFNEIPTTMTFLLSNLNEQCVTRALYNRCERNSSDHERVVINYSGELQYLKWDVDKGNWSLIWRGPKDKCSINNACGKFGSCNINNRVLCKCLPGFQPIYPEKWKSGDFLGGCTRNLTSFDNSEMFLSLKMMKVSNPESISDANDEKECRTKCLNFSQYCLAYSYQPVTKICWIWTGDLINLQEEFTNGGQNLSVRVAKSVLGSTTRNCEPCGTNLIPYPLSTETKCGDPMYFSFYCNASSGQVSFKTRNDTYRVASIDPSTRKFVIQVKHKGNDTNSTGILQRNNSLPFKATANSGYYSSEVKDEVEISWKRPEEPTCTSSIDCKDWPNSTCNVTRDGKRCLCTGNFQWDGLNLNCTKDGDQFPRSSKGKMSLTLIVMIPLIVVFLLTSAILCIYVWRRKMAKRQELSRKSEERNRVLRRLDSERHLKDLIGMGEFKEEDGKGIDVPFFDLESILAATDSFSDANKLGQGGYGPVYKGTFSGGQEIAVKRLSSISGQGLEEFKNEVVLIAKLQHRNLVRLRGYCITGHEKILLYEYMPNKSLDSFIFDQKLSMCLNWEMRFKIILGIARGLVYLHHDSRLRIIHRDLKTSNILLDEKMNPKISDFGLAKIVGGEETGANTTRLAGTYGYMSPEYAQNGIFSVKSDVFSFGVVLLEIICGKKNTTMSLIGYAWRLWVENKVLDLMDQTLREVCNADQFVKCVNIGLLCVQDEPNDRPNMSNVVTMLDSETGNVPTPKRPAIVSGIGFSSTTSSSTRPDTLTESTSSFGGT